MKKTAAMLLIAVLLSTSCGSSSRPSSIFNGTYSGRLSGVSCVTGETLNIVVRHHVESVGDENGDAVELVDADGNLYRGQVSLLLSEGPGFYGFALDTIEDNQAIARSITYNFFTRPEGQPSVSMVFRQTVRDGARSLALEVSDPAGADDAVTDDTAGSSSSSSSSDDGGDSSSTSSSSSGGSEAEDTCEYLISGQLAKDGPG